MRLILPILYIALGAWLLISPLVYIHWHFNREVRRRYEEHVHAVFLGTLITLTVAIGAGLTLLLIQIPESWGNLNHDGVFVRMRGYMAFTLGLLVAIHLMQSMSKQEAVEDNKRSLCHELKVNRRFGELDYLNYMKPSKGEDEWADMVGSPIRRHNMRINVMLFQMF